MTAAIDADDDGLLDALELAEGTRSRELLRLLHVLGPAGVPRSELTPDLLGDDLPGVTAEELERLLTHLIRIGVADLRMETVESAPGAGTPRTSVAAEPLASAALFE